MVSIVKQVALGAGILGLGAAAVQLAPGHETAIAATSAGARPVEVTNTPAQAVPTVAQGTTAVAGTVSIGNTPTVNVAAMPAIKLTSSDAREPVYLAAFVSTSGTDAVVSFNLVGQDAPYAVPPGKQLVSEQLSIACDMPAGARVSPRIEIGDGQNTPLQLTIQLAPNAPDGSGAGATIAFPVHVSAGRVISLAIGSTASGANLCRAAINGYYVDDPSSVTP